VERGSGHASPSSSSSPSSSLFRKGGFVWCFCRTRSVDAYILFFMPIYISFRYLFYQQA